MSVALSVIQAPAAQANLLPQEPLTITSTNGYTEVPLVLTTEGGSGSGAVSFKLIIRSRDIGGSGGYGEGLRRSPNPFCTLTPPSQSASGQWELLNRAPHPDYYYSDYSSSAYSRLNPWVCDVLAVKAADGTFRDSGVGESIYFDYVQPQVPIVLTSVIGKVGQPLPITYSGGSGDGAVTYSVHDGTGRGCAIVNDQIIEHGIGSCVVTVTKAASYGYLEASSPATTVSFVAQVIAKSEKAKSGTQGTP